MNRRLILLFVSFLIVLSFSALTTEAQRKSSARRIKLPRAVSEALKNNCPDCVIAKVTREVENGVTIYDFEFKQGQGEMDVARDGTVIDRETAIAEAEVPAPALEAIRKAAAGGTISQIEKDEIRAELKDGKIIKLDAPKYAYEADLAKGKQVGEVVVTPEGQITEGPKWRKKGTKE